MVSSPYTQFIASLEGLSFQKDNNQIIAPFGRFQMFPPAEEEMTWDDSTTPPALRRLTYEDINKELTSATTKSKLFDTDDMMILLTLVILHPKILMIFFAMKASWKSQ